MGNMPNQSLSFLRSLRRRWKQWRKWIAQQPLGVQLLMTSVFYWLVIGLYMLLAGQSALAFDLAVPLWIASVLSIAVFAADAPERHSGWVHRLSRSSRFLIFSLVYWGIIGIYTWLRNSMTLEYAVLVWLSYIFAEWYVQRSRSKASQ